MAGLGFDCHDITMRHALGRLAVDGISLSVSPGEQVALIGPSGAGKTTMLGVLGAAQQPSEGTLTIDGQDPWSMSGRRLRRLRQSLFNAPQAPPLPPRQRVVTAVLGGRLPRWSALRSLASLWVAAEPRQAYEALQAFSLGDRLWSRVDRLSGGERQRVSLARGLVSDARAMLIDEPLSALDPALAGQTLQALISHCRERSATLICSLHQVDLALENFPRIIGLRDGQKVFDLPTGEVTRTIVRDLYFGREAQSDSASIHPLHPGQRELAQALIAPGRCA